MTAPGSLDRIRGAVLGAVVGDAFGGPLEGASASDMPRLVAARIARPAPWAYTDDGAMNLAVAESPASDVDPQAFLTELRRRVHDLPAWVSAALIEVAELLRGGATPREASRALGSGPLARESVFSALWAFLSSREAYPAAVTTAALLGGDVDSICAMTGALAGALHGKSGIPETWLQNLGHESPTVNEMLDLCARLGETSACDLVGDCGAVRALD